MPKAGLFAGEVTQAAPADNAVTSKQKGFQWMEYGNYWLPQSSSGGHSATHNGWWSADPDFPHPLNGNSYSEWSQSATFKSDVVPTFQNGDFGIVSLSGSDLFGLTYFPGSVDGMLWVYIRSNNLSVSNQIIASGTLRLNFDTATQAIGGGTGAFTEYTTTGWLTTDWYTVSYSYSQPLNRMVVSWVNLTRGEEVVSEVGTGVLDTFGMDILNNNNVDFLNNGFATEVSTVVWGGHGIATATGPIYTVNEPWDGHISSIFIHNKYVDLADEATRRKFSGIDGVKSVGENGEIPFDEQPLCYMPSGGPWDNKGTVDWGVYQNDFFIVDEPTYGSNLPPVAT